MPHPNRRADDPHDGKRHLVQDLVESTGSKLFARLAVPVLIGLIAWQGKDVLQELKQQRADIGMLQSDVRVIVTRLDEGVVRQVNSNSQQIGDHERRIQVLERTVKTP